MTEILEPGLRRGDILLLQILILLITLWISGCSTPSVPEVVSQPVVQKSPVVARVNGVEIRKEVVLDALYQSHGPQMLEELMLLEMVRHYAVERGAKANPQRVKNELVVFLDEMAPGKSKQEQRALLAYLLKSRGVSRGQFDLILERQSYLRELVDAKIDITEVMIQDEFQSRYGKKITVRQLTVGHVRKIEMVNQRLKAGESFKTLVETTSEDQRSLSRGGLIGPFTQSDAAIPVEIRQAAFALQKVGTVSQTVATTNQEGQPQWHLLQLEEILPADSTQLSDVRETLTQTIGQQIVKQRMGELQEKIKAKSKTFVLDPLLRP